MPFQAAGRDSEAAEGESVGVMLPLVCVGGGSGGGVGSGPNPTLEYLGKKIYGALLGLQKSTVFCLVAFNLYKKSVGKQKNGQILNFIL